MHRFQNSVDSASRLPRNGADAYRPRRYRPQLAVGFAPMNFQYPPMQYQQPERNSSPVTHQRPPYIQSYRKQSFGYRPLQCWDQPATEYRPERYQSMAQAVFKPDEQNLGSYNTASWRTGEFTHVYKPNEIQQSVVDSDGVFSTLNEQSDRKMDRRTIQKKSKSLSDIELSLYGNAEHNVFQLCYWKILCCSSKPEIYFLRNDNEDLCSLSKDIWSKFLEVQLPMKMFSEKIDFWKQMCFLLMSSHFEYDLQIMGSIVSGFATTESNLNLAVTTERAKNERWDDISCLNKVKMIIQDFVEIGNVETCSYPKSLLFTVNNGSNFKVKIGVNEYNSISSSELMRCYVESDWRVQPLFVAIKLWADRFGIYYPRSCSDYISSYPLQVMLIFFLRCGASPSVVPSFKEIGKIDYFKRRTDQLGIFAFSRFKKSDNKMSLGKLLCEFLMFYENFDFVNNVISLRPDCIMSKADYSRISIPKDDIYVEDLSFPNNITKGVCTSKLPEKIHNAARRARECLSSSGKLETLFD